MLVNYLLVCVLFGVGMMLNFVRLFLDNEYLLFL